MTKDESLEMALDAISKSNYFLYYWHENESASEADAYSTAMQLNEKAITAIKEALAQPEEQTSCSGQEPVAWMITTETQNGMRETYPVMGRYKDVQDLCDFGEPVPLYTSPQAKPWVGLTDEEIESIFSSCSVWDKFKYERMLEVKLKEKNT